MKLFMFLILFSITLFSVEVKQGSTSTNILPNAEIYIDKSNALTVEEIKEQPFFKNSKESLGFGYSPDFTVWVRFTLENKSSKKIDKIIEYANPLTTDVTFYDPRAKRVLKDGLTCMVSNRESLNPIFSITLEPYSSKTFYIRAYSHISPLFIKVQLWDVDSFFQYEVRHQLFLAMFFGAMGIIILYNFLIYLGTKEISYLYYVLFFIVSTIHHILYLGVMGLYLLSPEGIGVTVEFSAIFVALPAFFLALFTQSILELKQYPKLNKFLNYYLITFPILVIILQVLELYRFKNLFSVLLLIVLFFIIIYTFFKRNRQSYFLSFGWVLIISSGLFMYLASLGIFNIFSFFPYYIEFSIIIESLIFSILLADKIKQLHKEKIVLQENFITYQNNEKKKLSLMVEEKTEALNNSLYEKELLLRELNHRVKNSIQTIVSFLRLQIGELEEKQTQQLLRNIENRIMSISHLYSLLYTKENICFVNTHEYFSLLVEDIETSYAMPHVTIELKTEINIPSEYAIYCGFILNECITNSLQHAFKGKESGKIIVHLKEEKNIYKLSLCDNGIGYNSNTHNDSLGLVIIETLVLVQLKGTLKVASKDGTKIDIEWRVNG